MKRTLQELTIKDPFMFAATMSDEAQCRTLLSISFNVEVQVKDNKNLPKANKLVQLLAQQNRMDDIIKAANDSEYQEQLFEEFHL